MRSRATEAVALASAPFAQWSARRNERTHHAVRRVLSAADDGDRHALASALGTLQAELSARTAVLADLLPVLEVHAGLTRRLRRAWRDYDDLASEAEGLAVAAATGGVDDDLLSRARDLVRRSRDAMHEERDGWIDAYWVDVGVGD